MTDKKDIVKMLKQNAEGKKVIFAADDDREGKQSHGIQHIF